MSAPTLASPAQVTLHSRIREELRARIVSGAWQPHDRMPSESELMAQYGVSRITVRQALADLENAQLIFKVPGKGSFVAQAKPYQELGRLQGFAEAMAPRGHDTLNRVLHVRPVPAQAAVARALQLAPHTQVLEIRRVRLLDGQPVSVDLTWLPAALGERVQQADLASRDIFHILETDCGRPLGHADLAIDATLADAPVAALLGLDAGAPVLRIERLTHDRHGVPVDYEHLLCRSDTFQYRLRLQRG
ncbi:GntR family transcriptional regulator [Ideonella sp. BN130291]|uniref:GntR family transcriptional regulator n=1 Tax=Ideonella sp. BN130291 TaxID=3112940 RepID=UPI002E272987|nr:GntR family transcriptional regulator [Ideonella sp. BN130291]